VFTLYDQEKHGAAAFAFGHDPRVAGHASLARTLQLLGYPEQASTRARHALALAEELGHTNTQAFALKEAAAIRLAGGDVSAAKENIEELVRLAAEERLPLYRIVAELYLGWVHCHEGRPEQGVASMRHALDGIRVIGFDAEHTQFSALLVEAYGRAGQAEEALAAVNEALEFAERTGEVYYEPELLRLKGELFLERDEAGAQTCFQQALDVARQQRARSWELRAATSLARLWQRQGRREDAKKLLAAVHDWFTEGFDSADMKAAKTLLEELAG
jgi:adenylate cyclase